MKRYSIEETKSQAELISTLGITHAHMKHPEIISLIKEWLEINGCFEWNFISIDKISPENKIFDVEINKETNKACTIYKLWRTIPSHLKLVTED